MTSSIAQKSKPLPAGIYCPVLSLYKPTPRQEIDYEASYKYFAYLIRGGVDGLVMAGTTAEAVLLSATERQELVRVARRAATDLGLPDFPVVAGISGQSTNETIRLAQDAHEAGGDFGLLLPPSYWVKAVTKDVIIDFYREVADNSPIPIVIYSVRILPYLFHPTAGICVC
jgi:dihydrodipicolinate synthase/N-acetylneuraminate lyase